MVELNPDAVAAAPNSVEDLDQRARVWAEIDLDAIAHNYACVAGRIPAGTGILAVLKADAYGHGAVVCARKLVDLGVSMIGVGDSREALELRAAGIEAPLLVLGAIVEGEMRAVVENDIATCIHSAQRAQLLSKVAGALGRRARVHLKVDTGMGRLGVRPEVARELAASIARDSSLVLEGICTHYGSAASPVPFHTAEQIGSFVRLLEEIRADGVNPRFVHASNSAAVFSTLREHFSMVRTGLALFGLNPGNLPVGESPVKPVLALRTQVVFLKDLPPSSPVGYNRTHVTKRPTRIAIVPFGYSDGYPYALSNRAHVLVRGERANVVGAVSMDYTTIDVSDIPDVTVGEEVTVIGTSGRRRIAVEDLARAIGTIPYEITARLGRRVARVPVEQARPLA
jgi:alanine racemase